MTLDGLVRQLLEEIKYKHGFPPREAAEIKKNELAIQGLGRSGALIQEVSRIYIEAVKRILDEFTDQVLSKTSALGLRGNAETRRAVVDAHQRIFAEARGALLDEFGGTPDYGRDAMGILDDRLTPVWQHLERKIELRKLQEPTPASAAPKEREQKFGILLSAGQAARDFDEFLADAKKWENPIAVLFVDLDHFKALNMRWTETEVDKTIFPEAQNLLAKLVQGRGEAYRYGGEEFLLILRNVDAQEAEVFGEKVRKAFEGHSFEIDGKVEKVTVSVGVAVWPEHGATYQEVLVAANRAEAEAKQTRNTVKVAQTQ